MTLRSLFLTLGLALGLSAGSMALAQETAAPEPPAPQATTPEAPEAATPEAPAGPVEVQVGAYILRLSNVSPRDGTFDVDMWMWFRWQGDEKFRPEETFEIANGLITGRTPVQLERDGDYHYTTLRVQATVFHDFDVRRFPMDNHVIEIEIEDAQTDEDGLIYVPDVANTALDPTVAVAGWQVGLQAASVTSHVYATNYGLQSKGDGGAVYSRVSIPITLDRTSYGVLFKSFWVSALAVLLGLLAFLVKSDDLDARFGMGVGSIFAASANAFVISDTLPETTIITLAEQINLIAVGVIFLTVFISIWSLRLRYVGRDEASVLLDKIAMFSFAAAYIGLNILVMTVDLSWIGS